MVQKMTLNTQNIRVNIVLQNLNMTFIMMNVPKVVRDSLSIHQMANVNIVLRMRSTQIDCNNVCLLNLNMELMIGIKLNNIQIVPNKLVTMILLLNSVNNIPTLLLYIINKGSFLDGKVDNIGLFHFLFHNVVKI